LGIVVQDHIQQGIMDLEFSVVFNFTRTFGKRSAYRGRNPHKTLSIVCGGAATLSTPESKPVPGELLDADVAIFELGASSFILQNYFKKEWAENCMMQLMVDDLDAWWMHIEALDLVATFGVASPRPPAIQPWGLRVAFVFDPSGVLWHVAERREGNAAD
jgi:uncharacterized glyoxalase superfamily protein PhnB